MQKTSDSKIQAKVRILLARRWVDLRSVTIGTTNGVVYIGGDVRISGGSGAWDQTSAGADGAGGTRWLSRIRREISEIPEVRDVVFQLDGQGPMRETWPQETV